MKRGPLNLESLLKNLHQEQLLERIKKLPLDQQASMLQQLKPIDPQVLLEQQQMLKQTLDSPAFAPFRSLLKAESGHIELGKRLLAEGKVGCIMVAGGQGTRLGFDGPKGAYPVTPACHKSLFQYFGERVKAASVQAGQSLPLAIMTSPLNDQQTKSHFAAHDYFGCVSKQISFFSQGTLPFLDTDGNLVFETQNQLAFGPDGNGSCIQAFFKSGIAEQWEQEGIEYITFIMVDNPLADPFDALLIGSHAYSQADVTLKCIERIGLDEKVGVLVDVQGKATILEYSEFPAADWAAKDAQGRLIYNIANISLFCFSFAFLKKISKKPLPLHKAYKKVTPQQEATAWKFERFIFDILPLAFSVKALLYPRDTCFAPLKNATGIDSIKTTQAALTHFDRHCLASITHKPIPSTCQEIDPAFYYPTPALLEKWKEKELPSTPYIAS